MISRSILSLTLSAVMLGGFTVATANQTYEASAASAPSASPFVKKRYSIKGGWSLVEADGQTQIHFSEGFKTKGGPDLKVFLSKTPIDELDSKTAASDTKSIGVLKSKSGGQIYTVPGDIDLLDYKSVIIHCEAFSVLWGGFDLPVQTTQLTPKP